MKHQEIKKLLPEVFQQTAIKNSPLYGLLEVMQAMTEPAEDILQQLPIYFNPYTTPEKFLPFLASWVDLDRFFPMFQNQTEIGVPYSHIIDAGHLRELIIAAPQLSKLRGTVTGMRMFLQTATGLQNFEINENNLKPFHIEITAPKNAIKRNLLIKRIIEQEKPAYVTYILKYAEKNHG